MSSENTKEYIKGIAIVLAIVIVGFALKGFLLGGNNDGINSNVVLAANNGEVQYVTLKMENYGYVIEPSEMKVGVPTVMTVDLDSVYGCMRDVVIPEYNIKKYVSEGDNIIKFTPTKIGKLPVTCSMNMGRGILKVV